MSKDAYYFSHDSNAKDDPKCVLLIEQLGMEGYGIFWMLIEVLRDQPDYTYPVDNISALARRYNTSAEKVKTVVYNYGLFTIFEDRIFFSESFNRRMAMANKKRQKLIEAGRLGAETRWQNERNNSGAIAMPSQRHRNAIAIKGNKSKGNKRIVNNRTIEDDFLSEIIGEFQDIVRDWFEYKRERKEAYNSTRSMQAFYSQLKNLSHDDPHIAREITNQSMANNWAGIFQLKTERNDNQSHPNRPSSTIFTGNHYGQSTI